MKSTTAFLVPIAFGLISATYATSNIRVYLHPSPLRTANNDLRLTPEEASQAVARFVGLDLFESSEGEGRAEMEIYGNYGEEEVLSGGGRRLEVDFGGEESGSFVGKGMGRSLVIGVDSETDLEGMSLSFSK